MIINFYIRENDLHLIEQLKGISEEKNRSISFIIREALACYLGAIQKSNPKSQRRRKGDS